MSGDRHLETANEPAGLTINYYLKDSLEQKTSIAIHDATGEEVATLEGDSNSGVNQVQWDTSEIEDVIPGIYRIRLLAGESKQVKFAKLLPPRAFPVGRIDGDLTDDGSR